MLLLHSRLLNLIDCKVKRLCLISNFLIRNLKRATLAFNKRMIVKNKRQKRKGNMLFNFKSKWPITKVNLLSQIKESREEAGAYSLISKLRYPNKKTQKCLIISSILLNSFRPFNHSSNLTVIKIMAIQINYHQPISSLHNFTHNFRWHSISQFNLKCKFSSNNSIQCLSKIPNSSQ